MTTYESATFSRAAMGTPSDAEFRAWGSACEDAIAGAGLTMVSSPVDWATTTIPAVAGTINANDYATYKFNDGLEELYIRFGWGRGNITAAQAHQYLIQCIIAKDSAMTLGTTTSYVTSGSSASLISDWSWHASFGDNCFVLTEEHALMGSSYNPATVVVERSRDNDGTVNEEAAILLMTGNTLNSVSTITANALAAQRQFVYSPLNASATANTTHVGFAGSSATANEDIAAPIVWGYDANLCQMRSMLAMRATSISSRQNITIKRNGVDKAYRVNAMGAGSFVATSATYRMIYRWE